MDDETFVAAIEASPDDPALKLVYADWLEQRGDPRAELLRLDGELWRTPIDLVRVRSIERCRFSLRRDCDLRWIVRSSRPSFAELRRRLEVLASLEPGSRRDYRLGEPLAIAQVETLEARLGCRLPEQYRRFITELGDGVVGPMLHGVRRLEDIIGDYLTPPFDASETLEGGLPICTHPVFGGMHWMMLAGPDAGCVWTFTSLGFAPEVIRGAPIGDLDLRGPDVELRLAAPREAHVGFVDWLVQELDQELWSIAMQTVDRVDVFDRPPAQVIHINFSDAGFTEVPDGLRRMTAVCELDLSSNPIEELPEWIGELVELEHLTLRRTKLRQLPPSIGDLRALSRLDLAHTSTLEQLPESIGQLSRLRSIDVESCGLVALPDAIGDLPLTELDLTRNRLVRIPASIGRMKLRVLRLRNNLLTELPDELERLGELTELDLSDNPLTTLPDWVSRLPRLESLSLNETPALDLVDTCRKLQHARMLRWLSFHKCGLTAIPDEIGLLTQLESLTLCCNELTSLPSSIARLTRLRIIYVENNDDSLPERVRELLPHLHEAPA